MFLYPTGAFFSLSVLNFSTFSVVSGSPPVGTVESGEEQRLEVAGDTERVVGGLTTVESALDAAVLTSETCEPVLSNCAASRGRDDAAWLGGGGALPDAEMRAAS